MTRVELTDKVAVVTGAGRGLGRAYAEALAAAGAGVVVNDADADAANETVEAITQAGGSAVAQLAAVGSTEAAELIAACAVDSFGRLDVICCNAGVLRDRVLWEMTDDDFDAVLDTHLRGTFTCARAAAQRMRERGEGGRLILVGSRAGQRGNFGQTNYAAAKAGIAALARTWAMECARDQITVNAVIPTALTRVAETIPTYAPLAALVAEGQPLPRSVRRGYALGLPEDAAGLVVFLASDAASSITGRCVGLGGDRLALWSHPDEVVTAYQDDGWSADDIAAAWPSAFAAHEQSYGIVMSEIDWDKETHHGA